MILGGVQFEIEQSYTALVTQAYQSAWVEVGNGRFETNDRPFTDRRSTKFQVAEMLGDETVNALFDLRDQQFVWLECEEGEEVFGAEVDHSSPLKVGIKTIDDLRIDSLATGSIQIELELLQAPDIITGTGKGLGALKFPHAQEEGLDRSLRYTQLSGGGAASNYSGEYSRSFRMTFSLTTEEIRDVVVRLLTIRTGVHSLGDRSIKVLKWGGCVREAFDLWSITLEWVDET